MASRRQRIACLLAAFVLGLAGPAWGQGAGDEQYQDPFGEDGGQSEEEAPAAPAEPEEPAPAPAPTAAPAAESSQAPATPDGGGGEGELAYTGAETGLLALAGAALVASGLALRRRSS